MNNLAAFYTEHFARHNDAVELIKQSLAIRRSVLPQGEFCRDYFCFLVARGAAEGSEACLPQKKKRETI